MAGSDDDPTRPDPGQESLGHYIPADDPDPDPPNAPDRLPKGSPGSIQIGTPPRVLLGLIRIILRFLLRLFGVIRVGLQAIIGVLRRIVAILDRKLDSDESHDDPAPSDPDRPEPPPG